MPPSRLRSFRLPLFFLFLLLWLLPSTASAAAPPHLAALKISLWPEYDKPSVLVMYDLTLPDDAALPLSLNIRIPARAGQPYAVAYQEPGGSLVNADFQYRAGETWGTITVNAMTPNLHIEYYDPALNKQGNRRTYVFQWPGDFEIDALALTVQQPADASDFRITPAMGTGALEDDGLVYYHTDLGALAAGQPFEVTIAYTKESDALSKNTLRPQSNLPTNQPAQGEVTWHKVMPWVITALGVVLIVIGLVWYWSSSRSVPAAATRPRHRRKRQPLPPETLAADAAEVRYCPQCGARAQPGDRFCRTCGTPLR